MPHTNTNSWSCSCSSSPSRHQNSHILKLQHTYWQRARTSHRHLPGERNRCLFLTREMDEESFLFQFMQRTPSLWRIDRWEPAILVPGWVLSLSPTTVRQYLVCAWVAGQQTTPVRPNPTEPGAYLRRICGKRDDVEHYLTCPVGGLRKTSATMNWEECLVKCRRKPCQNLMCVLRA